MADDENGNGATWFWVGAVVVTLALTALANADALQKWLSP